MSKSSKILLILTFVAIIFSIGIIIINLSNDSATTIQTQNAPF